MLKTRAFKKFDMKVKSGVNMIKYPLHTSMELGIMKKLLDKLYFDTELITY